MKKFILPALVILALLAACAPSATPTPTPVADESAISPAVITVDMFYTFINAAQSPEELGLPWNMLTIEEQCNPRDDCDLTNFTNTWWESMAAYRLYSCGTDIIVVEEMLYARDAAQPTTMTDSRFWTFELIDNDGLFLINKRYPVKGPGEECILAIDRVSNP
ncbi:MAG: hypothetical protein C4583_16375 [Anaerolineaceae bacterium]|nr:MAG: hypothetical protein C4583_16375 [Anaerolineaceae bacterium]